MSGDISIDIGSALPYLEEKIRGWFGQDAERRGAKQLLAKLVREAAHDASRVQIVGMEKPVPIHEVYQPLGLTTERLSERQVSFAEVLAQDGDAVIFGGPGRGKTTLFHYQFVSLSARSDLLPVLITLRWPGALADFQSLVTYLIQGVLKVPRGKRLLLLVDGFDELGPDERIAVAAALRGFASANAGNFYLSSRTFYDVHDIKANQFHLAPFSPADAQRYIEAFARAYKVELNAELLLRDLAKFRFGDFAMHPLLLALVCILKTGTMPALPRTPVGLLRRGVDTLTFRWDAAKGVVRTSDIDVDGDDRVRCLMKVAFNMRTPYESEDVVQRVVSGFLKLQQKPNVNTAQLLLELAQWYGMLIPASDAKWTFAHRTIHDFLAARHWVESGTFNPVDVRDWASRAAYAACLLPDATRTITRGLRESAEMNFFVECLYNNARFDESEVAAAFMDHFERFKPFKHFTSADGILVSTDQDIFDFASEPLLYAMFAASVRRDTQASDVVLLHVLLELHRRKLAPPNEIHQIRSRWKVGTAVAVRRGPRVHRFRSPEFTRES